jgi:hypothetical protein
VSLHVKQDLLPPGIRFILPVDGTASSATRPGGSPESLEGSLVLQRDPVDYRLFTLGPVSLSLLGAPPFSITAPSSAGGTMTLDPMTRSVTSTLTWTFDGIPVTRVVDGVGESFDGPATAPTGLHFEEQALPGLQDLVLGVRRVEIVPGGSAPVFGQIYQPLFRCQPGSSYALAASLDPAPGFSSLVGDIYAEPDILLFFSLDPLNGFFSNMSGVAPPSGEVRPQILIPNVPLLAGVAFFLAGVNFDPLSGALLAATNSHRVIL